MTDALAMALLDLRGLRPEDYAELHPRGALGWRSVVRVSDLMRSGPITSLVVVDDAGCPAGVIHLHDIQRAKIV